MCTVHVCLRYRLIKEKGVKQSDHKFPFRQSKAHKQGHGNKWKLFLWKIFFCYMTNSVHQERVLLNINYRKWQAGWGLRMLIIWEHIHKFAICKRTTPAKINLPSLHEALLILMLLTSLQYHSGPVSIIRFRRVGESTLSFRRINPLTRSLSCSRSYKPPFNKVL